MAATSAARSVWFQMPTYVPQIAHLRPNYNNSAEMSCVRFSNWHYSNFLNWQFRQILIRIVLHVNILQPGELKKCFSIPKTK